MDRPTSSDQPSASAPIEAGPQPTAAVTPERPAAAGARVFDSETRALLTAALDRLIPSHADLPGAGDLGVANYLERILAADVGLRRLFLDGLRRIEIAAGAPFAELDGATQDGALRRVEAAEPAFFAAFVNHAYRGYYTHRRVLQHLEATAGYAACPPQPLGHRLPAWDPALLDRQRERAPFWRPTDAAR